MKKSKRTANQVMKHVKAVRSRREGPTASANSIPESNRSSHTLPSVLTAASTPHAKAIELQKMTILLVREKLINDPLVPSDITDSQIVEYLNCTNFDPDRCVSYLKTAFKTMMELPQLFTGRDPSAPEAIQFWNVVYMAAFPKKSKEGYKFVYFGLKDPDPSHFNTVWNMKMYIMALEAIVRSSDLVPGFIFILDGKGTCLSHTPISQLRFLKKAIGYLQECSLVNMKKIHFVNASSMVERAYSLLKPFLNVNVTESLFFYTDGTMLAKTEDPSTLPPELGGTLSGSIPLFTEHLREVVESNAEYFKEDEDRRVMKFREARKPSTDTPTIKRPESR
uniref:Alpha-tocopherol transfer protein-like protein n=1 Tax=Lygus hesperus TaxID=30085 RepID=A0A0A9WSR6_LYGHE